MAAFAVLIALDLEGQWSLDLSWIEHGFGIIVDVWLEFEGGEKALHTRVIPASALGGHAAADLMLP